MSLRLALVAFAVSVATVIGFCAFVCLAFIWPLGEVDAMIGPFPREVTEVFVLYETEGWTRVMDEYHTDIISMRVDSVPDPSYFSSPWSRIPLPDEYMPMSVHWVNSSKYGVLAYTACRTWRLWWISEANIRRPSWRSYFSGAGRHASIKLTDADAVPVSQVEAMRLLGLPEQPAEKAE